jgi:hypothetical protein
MREYLVCLKDGKPSTLMEITSKKQRKRLFKEALLFELPESIVNRHLRYEKGVFEGQINSEELAPKYLKKCFQQ